MDTDIRALLAVAQTYFDAAHEMDADKFASVSSFEFRDESWRGRQYERDADRNLAGSRPQVGSSERPGSQRHDEVLSIDLAGNSRS